MKDKLLTKIFMTAFQKAKSNPEDVKIEAVRKLHTIIYFLLFSITRVGQCEPVFCGGWTLQKLEGKIPMLVQDRGAYHKEGKGIDM